ncbi:MAG: c-type cytochrome [Bacteroidetes bacterium]|nr:c-type cytochrome [Bacteroidota bacterium]
MFTKKPVRILVDMVISTIFLITGVWMLLNIPGSLIGTLLIIKIGLVFLSIPLAIIGFKKNKKGIAVVAVALVLGAYGLGEMNKKRPAVNESMVRTSVTANELFVASNCALCHGVEGKQPNTAIGAIDLTKSKISDDEISKRITNGKNNMPGYKKRLSEEQVKMLTEYVKSLRN